MARFISIQNSFAYGALSKKMLARTDLDFYKQGALTIENMELIPEGGLTKRNGLLDAGDDYLPSWSGPILNDRCVFSIPFKSSTNRNFLISFYRKTNSNVDSVLKVEERTSLGELTPADISLPVNIAGFPTDYIQLGDIIILTFNFLVPQCLYFKDGKFYMTPYASFLNTVNSYLATPVDQSRADLSVSIYTNTSAIGPNALTAQVTIAGSGNYAFPLFEMGDSWEKNSIEGSIALHHVASTTDYVFQTSWHVFSKTPPAPVTKTPTASLFTFLVGDGFTGYDKVRYVNSADGSTNIGYLGAPLNAPNLDHYVYPTWIDAVKGTNKLLFSSDVTFSLRGTSLVQCNTEIAAPTFGSSNATNVFYESYWGSKYGTPTCVGMISGRLSFSGIAGKAGLINLAAQQNLFKLNPAKLRQDDQAYYKVNTKAKDVSGLNYFGEKVGLDPDSAYINTGSVEIIRWIEAAGSMSILGTDRAEVAFVAETLDTAINYTNFTVSSYGSKNNTALAAANSVYFANKFNELIQITQEGQSIKANNISSLNSTIIDFEIGYIVFDAKKQMLTLCPYYGKSFVNFSVSRLTGVAGFTKHTFSIESTAQLVFAGIIADTLYTIRYDNDNVANIKFAYSDRLSYSDLGLNKFMARLETLPIDQGNPYGTSIGTIRRLHSIVMKLYETGHCTFGSSVSNMETLQLEVGTNFSGEKVLNFPASPDTNSTVIIESDEDKPLTILGIVYKGEGYE